MPAKAGIQSLSHVYSHLHQKNLDSRLRGNDEREVDFESTLTKSLGIEPRVVQLLLLFQLIEGYHVAGNFRQRNLFHLFERR